MNSSRKFRKALTLLVYLGLFAVGDHFYFAQAQTGPLTVILTSPTNGQSFLAPATINLSAGLADTNLIRSVQYRSGTVQQIGLVIITNGVSVTNAADPNPFNATWSNVAAGTYTLTAFAYDIQGNGTTSAPITITVTNAPQPPPPPTPFTVTVTSPVGTYTEIGGTTNLALRSYITDTNTIVSVQYFSGTNSLGTYFGSTPPYSLTWSNVQTGNYTLTAIATDSTGATATSAPVNVNVTIPNLPRVPFTVNIDWATNGQTFFTSDTVYLGVWVTDSNVVRNVRFYSNSTLIATSPNPCGCVYTNEPKTKIDLPFECHFQIVQPGTYTYFAVGTDEYGATATSAPVTISVVTPPPPPPPPPAPIVSIFATDPVATTAINPYYTNTATFLIRRNYTTNSSLTVYYNISGTASNGVDYTTIPNNITLAAGQGTGTITIKPVSTNTSAGLFKSIILALTEPPGVTNTNSAPYLIGVPAKAGAVILEQGVPPTARPLTWCLPDHSIYVSFPATNGMSYCLQSSTNLVDWTSVCTNTVVKGSAQFLDPDTTNGNGAFYRVVPSSPPAY